MGLTKDKRLCPGSLRSFPYFLLFFIILRPFSFSPKKKGQKERRRSAWGRFFRELPHERKWELGGLRAPEVYQYISAGRNDTEKPPSPPPGGLEFFGKDSRTVLLFCHQSLTPTSPGSEGILPSLRPLLSCFTALTSMDCVLGSS